jgi:effector-binding domain-containing protein
MKPFRALRTSLLGITLAACASRPIQVAPEVAPAAVDTLEASWVVMPSWKERLAQHFVYVELRGDYRGFGRGMRSFLERLEGLGVEASGPPFGLFFDDPSRIQVDELRAWACVPVEGRPRLAAEMAEGDLPGGVVVYARVRGVGPQSARAYPGLLDLAQRFGWVPSVPVREVYLIDAESTTGAPQWITEIQIVCRGA